MSVGIHRKCADQSADQPVLRSGVTAQPRSPHSNHSDLRARQNKYWVGIHALRTRPGALQHQRLHKKGASDADHAESDLADRFSDPR